jgi:MscS family membrane protein
MVSVVTAFAASDRLYLSADDRHRQYEALSQTQRAVGHLDITKISPLLRGTDSIERVIQLAEVLNRIALPPVEQIPDRARAQRDSLKRWRIPDTEIDFVLMTDGPRQGEWLVSAETVARLPSFYDRVKQLPYRPGPTKELSEALRSISNGRINSLYDAFTNSPAGLIFIPARWLLNMPDWTKVRLFGVMAWQWAGFAIVTVIGLLILYGASRLSDRLAAGRAEDAGPGWHSLLIPLAIILLTGAFGPAALRVLRISGTPLAVIAFAQTITLALSAAWLVMVLAGAIGETVIRSERLRAQSLDSQLIRLVMRFTGVIVAIALLMAAADELGFPAFSVLAGLGIGGLAVALAARDSLANLLGSVLIMFEKPFRVGHLVKLSGVEGFVEDVGFRSTRIRTYDGSLVTVPNNSVVNATIENLSARSGFRQRCAFKLSQEATSAKVEAFCAGIKALLEQTPAARPNPWVYFQDIGENSFDVQVVFALDVESGSVAMDEREAFLLKVIDLAAELGIEFGSPATIVQLDGPPARPSTAIGTTSVAAN